MARRPSSPFIVSFIRFPPKVPVPCADKAGQTGCSACATHKISRILRCIKHIVVVYALSTYLKLSPGRTGWPSQERAGRCECSQSVTQGGKLDTLLDDFDPDAPLGK